MWDLTTRNYCKHFYVYPRFPNRVKKIVCFAGNAYYTKDEVDGLVGLKDVSKWSERMRKPMEEIYGQVSMKIGVDMSKALHFAYVSHGTPLGGD